VTERRWIAFAWFSVLSAGVLFAVGTVQSVVGPTLETSWDPTTGIVERTIPGGPGDRAGITPGDRLLVIAGGPIDSASPLYGVRTAEATPVEFARAGVRRAVRVVPESLESARRRALRAGAAPAAWALGSWLNLAVNVWMYGLGIALLALRPGIAAARVASLELTFWAGGNFLLPKSGMGPLLGFLPMPFRLAVYFGDAIFLALFFSACVHFALVFPEPFPSVRRRRWLQALPYLAALPLVFAQWADDVRFLLPAARNRVPMLPSDLFYQLIGPGLIITAVTLLVRRFRSAADANSRRRLRLLFASLLPGLGAFLLDIALDRLHAPLALRRFGDLLQWAAVALGSLMFVYAVVKHRIFDIRILVRKSLQYALARGTLLLALSLPVAALMVFLYRHRRESLAEVFSGRPMLYVAIGVPLLAALASRRRLLDTLDRRFFREQFDSRRMLLNVVSLVRKGTDAPSLARAALGEVQAALHPKEISLWLVEAGTGELRRRVVLGVSASELPASSSLPETSALARLLSTEDEPLDLEARDGKALVRRLPTEEREWIDSARSSLIVPLLVDRRLVGLLLLGERLSEEPYGAEERELLRAIAAQLALSQEYASLKSSAPLLRTPSTSFSLAGRAGARACPTCRRCYPPDTSLCPRDGVELSDSDGTPLLIEEKYELRQLLGRGGMGSVYLAVQKRLGRPVAVKILLAHLLHDRDIRGRFEQEARVVAQLRHPAIVTVYDFGVLPAGNAYLVMEFLEGGTLHSLLKREGHLSPSRTVALLTPIAEAVDLAHEAGIIHRDLKPDNIMVLPESATIQVPAKVLDFGVARLENLTEEAEALRGNPTRAGTVLGTAAYMAPELFRGAIADRFSDQYSVGVVAYEMLSGAPPFPVRNDFRAAALAHTEQPPRPLREAAPHVTESMAAAVHRAMAKEPAERFPSVRDFVRALAARMTLDDAIPTLRTPL
jgi:hypothetical protein